VFATFLVWQVISQSFAAYFAGVEPMTALWLQPRQSAAIVKLADQELNLPRSAAPPTLRTSDQASQIRGDASAEVDSAPEDSSNDDFSTSDAMGQNLNVKGKLGRGTRDNLAYALRDDPLNATALRMLGQIAAAENDKINASKFMHAAAQLSLHESVAVYWLMLEAAEARDYQTTVYYANVLLRTLPEMGKYIMPLLAQMAEDKEGSTTLQAVLDDNPPWRGQFLAALPDSVTDARTPLELLLKLRTSATPPTSADVTRYIEFLIGRKLYDLAYYTWLQFLPADELHNAGLLFNGRFDFAPSGVPFDWMITSGSGVTIDIVPKSDSKGLNALLVEFLYGRVDYKSVTQLVMLTPGTYEFKGEYKGELAGPRGLKWRIVCANEATAGVGESSMIIGTTPAWKTVAFTFTVPDKDCRAQNVRLDLDARMASERLISGSMLFRDIQISRVANPS
jgi:hypothetical protein